MTHFNKYFLYRLKNSAMRTLIITLAASVFVFVFVYCIENISVLRYNNGDYYQNSSSVSAAVVMLILAAVLPILETSPLKNSKTLDVVFSLPINRKSIAIAHYLSGIFQLVFISLTVFLTANFTILIAGRRGYFATVYMIPMYLITLFFSICIYSFIIFIFGKANTVGDGIVFVGGFYVAVCRVILTLQYLCEEHIYLTYFLEKALKTNSIIDSFTMLPVKIDAILNFFDGKIDAYIFQDYYKDTTILKFLKDKDLFITIIFWGIAGILCTVGYILSTAKYRAEKAGDISDSLFGYRFIIPALGFYLMLGNTSNSAWTDILILIAMLMGYIIYRRSFKIKAEDLFTIAASLLFKLL